MRIGVFGLGYVGSVNATCLAQRGHTVTGVDVNRTKIDLVNAGVSPVKEPGLDAFLRPLVAEGRLRACDDAVGTVLATDLSLVCVGTPSNANGSLRLQYVEHVAEQIGEALRQAHRHHVVIFRSTMLPCTVEDFLIPILTRASGRAPGDGYSVLFHPEFLREGSALFDFEYPPKIVVGCSARDHQGRAAMADLYSSFSVPITFTSIRVAEAVKYIDNIFHALKVAFANEIGNVCKALRVDSHEAMAIFCQDTKLNLSPEYLRPGSAFGGSCLPKDLRAFTYEARSRDVAVPLLEAIALSNEQQKANTLQLVRKTGKRRIGVLGLSFKADTDDLRESPSVDLVEGLLGKGCQVTVYDPVLKLDHLMGANLSYLEEELPHVAAMLRGSIEEVLEESDVLVVANRDQEFADIATKLRPEQVLIDLVRLPSINGHGHNYQGISW